ncbi:slipin family protein [Spirosoma sp. KUDC1026]|uniref:slipin family protein n=1 Tax=Spirosoma sp. KUDC1026 TaxID=2745947 RepID=UPI00159BB414|nr:slipin family protein [Spirosoma sp. KUDC1026]QKZ15266.1 slipin family protein [Spirosoma sp. KUDC1026]
MKTVHIQTWQIGLVFKQGGFKRLLSEGTHWLWPGETVHTYNRGERLQNPPVDLAILMTYPDVAAVLDVITVPNNEIALQYELTDSVRLFRAVLPAGRWAFWKGVKQYEYVKADLSQIVIPDTIALSSLLSTSLSSYVRSFTVEAHERGVLFIDWKFDRIVTPGTYHWWKNSTPIQVVKADTRQQQMEVSGQEMLTKDKASLRLSFYLQYQVGDIIKALVENREYDKQLYVAVQLALREYVGGLTLDELLDRKGELAPFVLAATTQKAAQLGVDLRGGGVRDIILPGDMRDIMNQVLMAEKKAQANSIMRREETASTRSLLNTAKLMEDNEMLWKLKEMEYVEKIADKINSISVSNDGSMVDQLKHLFVRERATKKP